MPSEKATRILKSKTDLTDAQISAMSEGQAWEKIYSLKKPKKLKPLTICFTGFGDTEKRDLERIAEATGLEVRSGVTQVLDFLCAGANAGPAKMAKAKDFGVRVIDVEVFMKIAEDGELPS